MMHVQQASLPTTIVAPLDRLARWTIEQYEQIVDTGVLEGRRIELIAGVMTEMSPVSNPHDACISMLNYEFAPVLQGRFSYRVQMGISAPNLVSILQPDYVIVTLRKDHYSTAKPTPPDIKLVVEVSLSSLDYDRETKAPLYATAGIAEYWIFNLVDRQLEVYALPKGANKYPSPNVYSESQSFQHSILGEVVVAELLPMSTSEG